MFAGKENNDLAREIKEYIEKAVLKLLAPQETTLPSNLSDELQKLAQLKEKGILSDDEFQTAKRKLIG